MKVVWTRWVKSDALFERRVKMMRRAFVAFPLLLLMSTYAAGQTTGGEAKSPAHSKDEAEISKVLAAFVEAWNKHDAKAFSMVFAEGADFTNVRGMSASGRAEIEQFHAPLFATRFKDTSQKMTKTKIRLIRPDVAAVDAWWEMTGVKGPEGQDIPLRRGLLNLVMTKEGEKWLIMVMHNMDLPSSP
jgi:uncharacterized protein (TIGR02246 family)